MKGTARERQREPAANLSAEYLNSEYTRNTRSRQFLFQIVAEAARGREHLHNLKRHLREVCAGFIPGDMCRWHRCDSARQAAADRISEESPFTRDRPQRREGESGGWEGGGGRRDDEKFNRGDEIMTTRRRKRRKPAAAVVSLTGSDVLFSLRRRRDPSRVELLCIVMSARSMFSLRRDIRSGHLIRRFSFYWTSVISAN